MICQSYLVLSSSLTNTVIIPNLLMYGWISALFDNIHNILDVSHCASYLLPMAMSLMVFKAARAFQKIVY